MNSKKTANLEAIFVASRLVTRFCFSKMCVDLREVTRLFIFFSQLHIHKQINLKLTVHINTLLIKCNLGYRNIILLIFFLTKQKRHDMIAKS